MKHPSPYPNLAGDHCPGHTNSAQEKGLRAPLGTPQHPRPGPWLSRDEVLSHGDGAAVGELRELAQPWLAGSCPSQARTKAGREGWRAARCCRFGRGRLQALGQGPVRRAAAELHLLEPGCWRGLGRRGAWLCPTTAWARRAAPGSFPGVIAYCHNPGHPPWFFNSGETLVKRCWHPCWLPASLPSADVSTGAVSLYGSAELCGHCWGSKEELKGFFSSRYHSLRWEHKEQRQDQALGL